MDNLKDLLSKHFDYLFEEELLEEIATVAKLKKVEEGQVLIDYQQPILSMPLLIDGALKVYRLNEEGEELLLYFLEGGDTCTMTMNCCIGNKKSKIRAVAEKETRLILIPTQKMANWIEQYPTWRTYVFSSYDTRFNELLEAIDSLAFLNMHDRLYKYLKDKVPFSKSVRLDTTHQEIAYDLNTSRVVISRLLKALEKEGKIKLYRNKIELLNY